MAFAIQKLRNLFVPNNTTTKPLESNLNPELGFKVSVNESNKELKVTVIGARHLPILYGTTRAEGYIVKVKLFPGREKFETKLHKESWPMFNQEFDFKLSTNSNQIHEQLSGKFIVLTVYTILENVRHNDESKSKPTLSEDSFKSLFMKSNLNENEEPKKKEKVILFRRRTVGAVTYSLEPKAFSQKLRNNCLGTPDIWRQVQSISSGLIQQKANTDDKGSVEVSFKYAVSEDGKNDMITVSLSRLRFTVHTMEMHENYTGSLYLKMKIHQSDNVIAKWKSDTFEPTISLKLDAATATIHVTVNNAYLKTVKCEVRLICKNKLGKKSQMGSIWIGPNDEQWMKALNVLDTPIIMWQYFK